MMLMSWVSSGFFLPPRDLAAVQRILRLPMNIFAEVGGLIPEIIFDERRWLRRCC